MYPPADSISGAYYRHVLRDEGFCIAGNDDVLNLEALLPPGLRENGNGTVPAAAATDGGSARAAKHAVVASLPKGAYRRVLQQVHDVQVEEAAAVTAVRTDASDADNGATGDAVKDAVVLRFSLPAGSFATALLRDVTHSDAFI
jgi:hypothetical protein